MVRPPTENSLTTGPLLGKAELYFIKSFLSSGYSFFVGKDGLCTIAQQGLNIAQIARTEADSQFRAQRLALQIGNDRVLIHHRHAHSASAARRNEYNEALMIANEYLNEKKVKNKYIYYIPSWQKLTNYKSIKSKLFDNNPQIIQLNTLKMSVKEIAEKNGFIFIDGEQIFINLEDPLKVFYYNLNTHFNRLGYRLMAQDLYNKILINN